MVFWVFPEDCCEVAKVLWMVTKALPLLKYFEIFAVIAMWLLRFFFPKANMLFWVVTSLLLCGC